MYHAPDTGAPGTRPGVAEEPGEYPFTRGVHSDMYRGRPWTIRQYAGFGTAEETNARFRYLLEQGQTGLSVAFDLPTQMGYDSDAAMAAGEVGRVGVAIASLDDMRLLLGGIRLDAVSTSMTINSTAAILLALYVALGDEQGVPRSKLSGTVQNDVLKEYVARGTYIYPAEQSLRLVADIIAFCSREIPKWNPISISGYHIREAGSTAPQEVGFTLANGLEYVRAAVDRGLPVDRFAPRVSFFFNAHNGFLDEIAKYRAARRLWARLMEERFHPSDPNSLKLRFHAQTAGSSLTAQQPHNNIARVAIQALAAVLGGCQSLHTNSFDEAISLPSEEAATAALRTQQVLAYETGVASTVDPTGGSAAIEERTDRIEREAHAMIEAIDALGGAVRAIEAGHQARAIERSAYEYQMRIEKGEQVVVGVNRFGDPDDMARPIFALDPKLEERQIARVGDFKASRDANLAAHALQRVEESARRELNLMPAIIDAVKAGGTLGEISDALRRVYGTYEPGA